jgi:hypothetical protein
MKIGFITSYHEKCGISAYSENLIQALIKENIEVKVVANYPKDQLEIDESYVKRFFHCPFMTNNTTADIDGIINYLSDKII